MAIRQDIVDAITSERDKQHVKWGKAHRWGWGDCSSKEVMPIVKAGVLAEECGEVARAVLDGDEAGLRRELIQVAAVAVAWLETYSNKGE